MIEYPLPGVPGAEPSYRVVTTLRDPDTAPATELAALYHERWDIETAFDELKTHLRGARIVLRRTLPAWRRFPPEDQPRALRAILDELGDEWVRPRRGRVVPQGVKRKMSNFPRRSRERHPSRFVNYTPQIITN